jgi:lactate dehydrogenase-like 2-hydroxyacid dehydrogenase
VSFSSSSCTTDTYGNSISSAAVVVLADLLRTETRHLVSTREFKQMKDGVGLVNIARGAVIDEAVLLKAAKLLL